MSKHGFHKQRNALAEIWRIFRFQFKKAGRNLEREKNELGLLPPVPPSQKEQQIWKKEAFLNVFYILHKKYVPFLTSSLDYCYLAAEVPVLPDEHRFDIFFQVESIKW